MLYSSRLNKIGKNPNLVSNRDNLDIDTKTVNAFVNAISTKESVDSFDLSDPRNINSIQPFCTFLQYLI